MSFREKTFMIFVFLAIILCAGNIILAITDIIDGPKDGHKMFVLSIFAACYAVICCNIMYQGVYTMRGNRYKWVVSWNSFIYMLCQLIGAVIIFSCSNYLRHWIIKAAISAMLFVILFVYNFLMNGIFNKLEEEIARAEEERAIFYGGAATAELYIPCVRIRLHGNNIDDALVRPTKGGPFKGGLSKAGPSK